MLSYRHSFHAGNHADVLKHATQTLIINALKKKEKPFIYLDTHAGAGAYLLNSDHANQTNEHVSGIQRIWQNRQTAPTALHPYLNTIKSLNSGATLTRYPGSPLLAKLLLRPQDQLFLSELHPSDYQALNKLCAKDNRIHCHYGDGYQQIKALLPPVSRRGLILIDPSYEIKDDYQQVVTLLQEGYKRFATGIFAIWYPVIFRQQIKKLLKQIYATKISEILHVELTVQPDNEHRGMTGSGMIIVNPPWQLEEQLNELLPWLHQQLSPQGYGQTSSTLLTAN